MAVWKDEKVAREALSGVRRVSPENGRKKYALLGLAVLLSCLGVYSVCKLRPSGTGAVPLSKQVALNAQSPTGDSEKPAQPAKPDNPTDSPTTTTIVSNPTQSTVSQPPAKAQTAAKPADEASTAVRVMPPVTLGESRNSKKTAPILDTEVSTASKAPTSKTEVSAVARSPYASAYSALNAGKPETVFEILKSAPTAAENSQEKKEYMVLEGRALLAMGKMAEARQKFEPLAFASADTAIGADALMGNFWCQAGKLTLCRDSELEQVRGGADSWGMATASFEQARRMEEDAKGELPKLERARALYQQAVDSGRLEDAAEAECLKHLIALTNQIVLDSRSPCTAPKAVFHKVEPGEGVEKIARSLKVNQGQIKRINKLNDKLIVRYGQLLKTLPGEVLYKVSRSKLTGTLYIDGVFIRRYPVGIGPGNATPVGTYIVDKKVINPDWWYDGKRVPFGDPLNILGTRWMGFSESTENGQGLGLGVHGTAHPESVPGRESKGCVRMHNSEVEEIYDFMPQGGKVQIVD